MPRREVGTVGHVCPFYCFYGGCKPRGGSPARRRSAGLCEPLDQCMKPAVPKTRPGIEVWTAGSESMAIGTNGDGPIYAALMAERAVFESRDVSTLLTRDAPARENHRTMGTTVSRKNV
ncbi:hypothetical protein NPIL_605451 [Nephila pilipes]|uniref:Uncharacterized protein n=1 Tax=Nephila pilipes TaxID=299642 RepID=A0A8X6QQ60_NEPPI|nr:hypothetical protein NPIL_605451 [Nephila pilipes]